MLYPLSRPDLVLIDADVFLNLFHGNASVLSEIEMLRKAGVQVNLTQWAFYEVLQQALQRLPTEIARREVAARQLAMHHLRIGVNQVPPDNRLKVSLLVEMAARRYNNQGQFTQFRISQKDHPHFAEAFQTHARLWSHDHSNQEAKDFARYIQVEMYQPTTPITRPTGRNNDEILS